MRSNHPALAALLALGLGACATTPPGQPLAPAAAPGPTVAANAPVAPAAPLRPVMPAPGEAPELRPYDRVITAEAKTQDGLFKIHTLRNRFLFEIPRAMLDKPLLMSANATAVPARVDHVGRALHQEVVRFSLKNNRVFLQSVSHAFVSDPGQPIAPAVQDSQRDAILAAFQVETFGKDGAPVIEVGRLFTSEVGDFSARAALRASGLDSSRSFIERSKAFAASLRIDAVHTYGFAAAPPVPGLPAVTPPRSGSVDVAYNIVQLPEQPMMPRLHDDRIGFLTLSQLDFGSAEHGSRPQRLVARWRLEKADPTAALSPPVKPLVWYIDRATPSWLVPYVKQGVEAWNIAFEAAGFKDAVQARPFPSAAEDPEFDPDDVRYSIIRWVPSAIPNAYSPHLSDPRSGEILNANMVIFHNIMQLQRDWYVTQAGAVDPRAQSLPLPDALMGELVAYVVSHELGHALGFPHNMRASSLYPVDKLRDPRWLREMGHVPSLMDYSRFNYLVQPEDGVDPALLIPRVGPYDIFATRWGYTPIPAAKTPQEELPTLNAWLREQDDKPWLRFSAPKAESEFGSASEAVGDADSVTATELGIRNLRRIVQRLPTMTLQPGQDDRRLEELYAAVWAQWSRELAHVAAIVGGYDTRNKHGDQPGAVFAPLPRAQQARAVQLLAEQLFVTPAWLFEPAIVERLRPSEPLQRLQAVQRAALRALLDPARGARLQMQQAQLGTRAYRIDELLTQLRGSIFPAAVATPQAAVAQRNLQRIYLETLAARLAAGGAADDGRAAVRAELKRLEALFTARLRDRSQHAQHAHWDELRATARRALDPQPTAVMAAPPMSLVLRPGWAWDDGMTGTAAGADHFCWPGHLHAPGAASSVE